MKEIMKRREGESFAEYKKRRAAEGKAAKAHLRGVEIEYTDKELINHRKLWGINA